MTHPMPSGCAACGSPAAIYDRQHLRNRRHPGMANNHPEFPASPVKNAPSHPDGIAKTGAHTRVTRHLPPHPPPHLTSVAPVFARNAATNGGSFWPPGGGGAAPPPPSLTNPAKTSKKEGVDFLNFSSPSSALALWLALGLAGSPHRGSLTGEKAKILWTALPFIKAHSCSLTLLTRVSSAKRERGTDGFPLF